MQMIVHLFLPFVFLLCISTQQPGVFEDCQSDAAMLVIRFRASW